MNDVKSTRGFRAHVIERAGDTFIVRDLFVVGTAVVPHSYRREPSLDAARASLPRGLACIDRDPEDAPHIVETWI